MKILVVQDSENGVREVQDVLQRAGYRVQAADDERQILEMPRKPGTSAGLVAVIEKGEEIAGLTESKVEGRQEEGLRFVKEVAAKVAHEIRNPLQKIVVNTFLLERTITVNERNARYMKSINDSVTELNTIVRDMLNFNHQVSLYCQPVDIGRLLEDVLSDMKELMDGTAVEIAREIESHLPLVALDPFKMKQVFVNLLTNALQAMTDTGGGTLTVRTRSLPAKNCLEIGFRDTGIGISESDLDHIFDPFFTRRQGGVGLGLSVVRQLVGAHGGRIQVESQPGKGSEFRIQLPICSNLHTG